MNGSWARRAASCLMVAALAGTALVNQRATANESSVDDVCTPRVLVLAADNAAAVTLAFLAAWEG